MSDEVDATPWDASSALESVPRCLQRVPCETRILLLGQHLLGVAGGGSTRGSDEVRHFEQRYRGPASRRLRRRNSPIPRADVIHAQGLVPFPGA